MDGYYKPRCSTKILAWKRRKLPFRMCPLSMRLKDQYPCFPSLLCVFFSCLIGHCASMGMNIDICLQFGVLILCIYVH